MNNEAHSLARELNVTYVRMQVLGTTTAAVAVTEDNAYTYFRTYTTRYKWLCLVIIVTDEENVSLSNVKTL